MKNLKNTKMETLYKIQHNRTGVIIAINKEGAKTIYGRVIENPLNDKMIRIGERVKTNLSLIGKTYTKIS